MLTADLIRYRIVGDDIFPRYISRRQAGTYLPICRRLIRLFQTHTGKTQQELLSSLEALEGTRTDFRIFRGFVKLLSEQAEFVPVKEIDYPSLRHNIFSKAQKHFPIVSRPDLLHQTQREHVLSKAAQELGLSLEETDTLLYGDLPENQILASFKSDYTPESLLKRYNLALAQGLLYWAIRMRVILSGDYRVVFQYVKLSRLMHWIKPLSPRGFEVLLNGPASLFHNTQRYGIRMANFLPGLLLAKEWEMVADIASPKGPKQFHLDSDCGLTTHYPSIPPFDSQIEENFFKKFSRKDRGWTIEREGELIDLGDTVFIPDFTFRHPDGRTASMEIIGYWTPEYLRKKKEKIQNSKMKNLILAVNSQLNCSREDFKEEVIFYRNGIKIAEVITKLEAVES